MRRLLQDGWNTSPDRAGDLQDLWLIDSAVVMIDPIRTAVEKAARKAPDDDRVWLASANVAVLSGRFPEASRWLDDCLRRRPDDPVVWRARLRWARATDSIDEARRAVRTFPPNVLRPLSYWSSRRGSLPTKVGCRKSGPRWNS